MDPREIAETFTAAIEAGDFDTAASYLADGFQFTTSMMPEPMGAQAWLGFSQALRAGVPDLRFNFEVGEAEGNTVAVLSQMTGTHTGDLDMTPMGIGVIPATGKSFSCSEEWSEGTVEGGKVVSIHVHATPESGVAGMLAQIGVQMPA